MIYFAKKDWYYNFRILNHIFTDRICEKNKLRLFRSYSQLTTNWNVELNTEWLCRFYLSAKMIMSSTLMINSLLYAKEKNIRVVSSYLYYYSLLHVMSALVYTMPSEKMNNGRFTGMSHNKVIKNAVEYIENYDKKIANDIKEMAYTLKAQRELISYRAPSSGEINMTMYDNFIDKCILISEFTQFNSEIMEKSILNKVKDTSLFSISNEVTEKIYTHEIEKIKFYDNEDWYRIDYLTRRVKKPINVLFTMTEGHVEDFFGAWYREPENDEDIFNPDINWDIIFDIL